MTHTIIITILILSLHSTPVGGEEYIYQWVDKKGNISYADDLSKVPEQFRDTVNTQKKNAGKPPITSIEQEKKAKPRSAESVDSEPYSDKGEQWWRTRKENLEAELAELKEKSEALDLDYLRLRRKKGSGIIGAVGYYGRRAEIAKKRDKIKKEIERLKDELYNKLPEEARKAGVPPGWLR